MRTRKAKRTMAQIKATARARKILRDPYYQELRGWHVGLGAKEALAALKRLDAILIAIEAPRTKRTCKTEGVTA